MLAYQTQDFGKNSYDLPFTGSFIQTQKDPRSEAGLSYAQQYFGAYALAYNTLLANSGQRRQHGRGRAGRPRAGRPLPAYGRLPEFNEARLRVVNDATPGVGSRINPSSLLNDVSGQYDYQSKLVNAVVGGASRQYRLGSDGMLFSDQDGKRIINDEFGAYLQLSKELLQNRLKLTAAGRVDDSKNFRPVFSPSGLGCVCLRQGEDAQPCGPVITQAYRTPTQQGQYLSLDLSRFCCWATSAMASRAIAPPLPAPLALY
ncbi:hypothetical protein LRS06_21360 [Hymenobacter sp. J193]|uniref:hypothetical protein n=1 Tax=Hymenobacter sp. J193 TaxID=2898429 RepID=UPI002151F7B0|nr:hypothetical protein [Hymenobacter sp. J193]MCR5890277.1 hypothetical protein [Hymenobacter sp. J193]